MGQGCIKGVVGWVESWRRRGGVEVVGKLGEGGGEEEEGKRGVEEEEEEEEGEGDGEEVEWE